MRGMTLLFVRRWALGVRTLGVFSSSFSGTSVIPHFGHFPGASITTSGCMTQVYFCDAATATAVKIASAIKIKIWFFIWKNPPT